MVLRKKVPLRRRSTRRKMTSTRRKLPLTRNPNRVGGPNTCKIVETLPFDDIIANQPYRFEVDGIIAGTRAAAVAQQFGLYRIAKITLKYKPASDTYVSNPAFIGGGGVFTVPNLYWKMNRFADAPAAFSADDLKNMGAKAFRFDDKAITISYRPNVLTSTVSAGTNSGQIKMTPWLNTDSAPDTPNFALSTQSHYGHFYIVEAGVNGNGQQPCGSVEATIVYEFKNPRVQYHTTGYSTIKCTSRPSTLLPATPPSA